MHSVIPHPFFLSTACTLEGVQSHVDTSGCSTLVQLQTGSNSCNLACASGYKPAQGANAVVCMYVQYVSGLKKQEV